MQPGEYLSTICAAGKLLEELPGSAQIGKDYGDDVFVPVHQHLGALTGDE